MRRDPDRRPAPDRPPSPAAGWLLAGLLALLPAGCGSTSPSSGGGGGGKGFTQAVIDLDPKVYEKASGGNPLPKGTAAKHPPGSVADLLQALSFVGGHEIKGVKDSVYRTYRGGVGGSWPPAMWEQVFGKPAGVTDSGDRFAKQKWEVRCTDGSAVLVGNLGPSPAVSVHAVHWDGYLPDFCAEK
jgi:hypothetical protein